MSLPALERGFAADVMLPVAGWAERTLGARVSGSAHAADGGSVLWSWIHPPPPVGVAGGRWFIAWGVRRPPGSTWWWDVGPQLPEDDHAFVCAGTDSSPLPLDLVELPQGWARSADEAVVGRLLASFAPPPDAQLASWIVERAQEAAAILRSASTSLR